MITESCGRRYNLKSLVTKGTVFLEVHLHATLTVNFFCALVLVITLVYFKFYAEILFCSYGFVITSVEIETVPCMTIALDEVIFSWVAVFAVCTIVSPICVIVMNYATALTTSDIMVAIAVFADCISIIVKVHIALTIQVSAVIALVNVITSPNGAVILYFVFCVLHCPSTILSMILVVVAVVIVLYAVFTYIEVAVYAVNVICIFTFSFAVMANINVLSDFKVGTHSYILLISKWFNGILICN